MQKKAAIVQDISCFGKCSAGVALPVVSHFNIECALLPTALFSAHTAFKHYTCLDLTAQMEAVMQDWRAAQLQFNGVYTGYLLSQRQAALTEQFLDLFALPDAFVLVDPIMGDNGKAYAVLGKDHAKGLRRLVARADVITPNLTEAALLLGQEPVLEGYSESRIAAMLQGLHALGAKIPMITGVSYAPDRIGVAWLEQGQMHYLDSQKFEGSFCGTGDLLASVVFAAMLQGAKTKEALQKALSALQTAMETDPQWYGISFERALQDF